MIKKLILLFIASVFCAAISCAQKINRVNIPLVRENAKIDALLDKYVKLGDPARSCFVLYADPIGGLYGLTVKGIKTDTAVLNLNFFNYKGEFGYFKYKKFLVFVVNTYDLFNFFEQTTHHKTFSYKWNPAEANNRGRYFCSADFNYPIGRFEPLTFSDPIPADELDAQAITSGKTVDSMLDKYIGLSDPAKSCFLINSYVANNEYSISVNGLRTDTTLLNMNVFRQNTELGYYRYKGYLVIVKIYADPYHFFPKNARSRKFRFEWDERKAENKELNPLGGTFCYNNYYRDKYGKFNSSVIFDMVPQKGIKQ